MLTIRKTTPADLDALLALFDEARATIAALGIDQWQNGYPNRAVLEADLALSQSYCVTIDGRPVATFAMLQDGESTYDRIFDGHWPRGDHNRDYIAIHRVAISVACRGQGIAAEIIAYAIDFARVLGRNSLRIDTHEGNVVMRKMLSKNGFTHCGTIFLANGDKRVAYEREV